MNPEITVGIIYSRPWCKKWLETQLQKHLPNPFRVDRKVVIIQVGNIPDLNLPIGLDCKVYRVDSDCPIGESRNIVLSVCETKYLVWQDDDDWHSETRIDCLYTIRHCDHPNSWALGKIESWTYDFRNHTLRHLSFGRPCCGTSIYKLDMVGCFSFDHESPGSDARWLNKIRKELGNEMKLTCENCDEHSLFIRHGFNTCVDPNGTSYCTSALFTKFGFPQEEYESLKRFCHESRIDTC